MMLGILDPKLVETLQALGLVYAEHGYATLDLVAEKMGRSRHTVYARLRRLVDAGYAEWPRYKHRTLRPVIQVVAHG